MKKAKRRKQRRLGEDHPKARLSDADVKLIREMAEAGMKPAQIAAKLDDYDPPISRFTIKDIVRRRRRYAVR